MSDRTGYDRRYREKHGGTSGILPDCGAFLFRPADACKRRAMQADSTFVHFRQRESRLDAGPQATVLRSDALLQILGVTRSRLAAPFDLATVLAEIGEAARALLGPNARPSGSTNRPPIDSC